MQQKLNLPPFQIRIQSIEGQHQVFDTIRKKFVALTPEEWVRQHFVNYLVTHRGYPAGLIAIEMPVNINGMMQRADIVAHSTAGEPILIVECKAPSIEVGGDTYAQAARYNLALRAKYLVVTNGLQHYCSEVNLEDKTFKHLQEIPHYTAIS